MRVPFSEYLWPMKDGFKPFSHQVEIVKFLLKNKRAFNLSDLGTGKTLSHLWTADFLMINDKIKQALIITPLSTMRSVWANEIFTHLPHRRYRIAHGTKDERLYAINSNADFLILNHDGVSIAEVEKAIIQKINRGDIGLVIIDELTAYKKHTTNRTKAMIRISHALGHKGGLHGATAAPTPNSPTEAFGQAKVVNPFNPLVPRYFKQFEASVEVKLGPFVTMPLPGAEQRVGEALSPAIRFNRDECIDIPPCQYLTHIVQITDEQRAAYKKMKEELLIEHSSGLITASNAAVKVMKLLQISAGSVKDDNGNSLKLDSSNRDEFLWNLFEQTGKTKLVVASAFRADILHLKEFFGKRKVKAEVIYGDVKHDTRAAHIKNFQEGDLQVLIIQPQSAAHGITLTAACDLVWYSLVASGEIHLQFNGRITRAGQTRKQRIHYLIGTQAEKRVLGILNGKERMSTSVLEMFEEMKPN